MNKMSEYDEESIFGKESVSLFNTEDWEMSVEETLNGEISLCFLSDSMEMYCKTPDELIEKLRNNSKHMLEAADKLQELVTSGKYKKIITFIEE